MASLCNLGLQLGTTICRGNRRNNIYRHFLYKYARLLLQGRSENRSGIVLGFRRSSQAAPWVRREYPSPIMSPRLKQAGQPTSGGRASEEASVCSLEEAHTKAVANHWQELHSAASSAIGDRDRTASASQRPACHIAGGGAEGP